MKIYFINRFFYPDYSSTSQMLTDLTTGLAAEHSITVVTSRRIYHDSLAKLERRDELDGVEILRVNTARSIRDTLWRRAIDYVSFYLRVLLFLLRYVRKDDLVVLKTDPPMLSLVNTAAVHIKGGKVVNWLQDLFPEVAMELGAFPRNRIFSAPLIWWRNRTLRAAKINVVISRKMQEFLAGQGVSNTICIPNWADGKLIRPLSHADNPLRTEWNPGHKFLVGYLGNFGRAHSFDELIQAMMLLKDRPEIHFVLIGEGAALDRLLEDVERKKLHNVSFQPYQPHDTLRQSLGAIDLHLVSLREGMEGLVFPSKIYSVLAAGRALAFIGDEDGEVAQSIHENTLGIAVGHGDGAILAEQIQKLADDPERLTRIGSKSRRLFDDKFALHRGLDRWRRLLDEVSPK